MMEVNTDEVPDTVFCYIDDGDIMRALGCLTFEAAHFEAAIESAYDAVAVAAVAPNDVDESATRALTLSSKVKFCATLLERGTVNCPNLVEMIDFLRHAEQLIRGRNVAIHGRLYQLFNGPLMRASTKHSGHVPTSSAEMYELAAALRIGSANLSLIALYAAPTAQAR
jgi:hypothetical protein